MNNLENNNISPDMPPVVNFAYNNRTIVLFGTEEVGKPVNNFKAYVLNPSITMVPGFDNGLVRVPYESKTVSFTGADLGRWLKNNATEIPFNGAKFHVVSATNKDI